MATTLVRPFFGFYGGKWRDAVKHYPAPRHDVIIEPFAGSAGYALRYWDRRVILCERDPVIAGVWRYLLQASADEILAIPDLPAGRTVDDMAIPQEARWLVGLWLNRATASPRKSPSKWMREGIRPGSFWGERVRRTIASQLPYIRHWTLIEGDYQNCGIPEPASWFIDLPYQRAGAHYRFGACRIDFAELAAWCRSRPGQVIVCENEGADWLPFRPLGNVKTTRTNRRSPEVLWTNDPVKPAFDGRAHAASRSASPLPLLTS